MLLKKKIQEKREGATTTTKQSYALYKLASWIDETEAYKGGRMYGVLTGALFSFLSIFLSYTSNLDLFPLHLLFP